MFNALILVLSLVAPVADEIDNPEYQRWAGFKPGSSVTVKTVNETHKVEMTTTTTLKSKDAKEIVLEMKTSMVIAGKTIEQPAQTRKVPAKIKKFTVKSDAKKPQTGKETLKVAKQDLACTWTKTIVEAGGTKTTSKVWMCDKVPGGLVRMESETTGATKMKTKQDLVSFVAK